MGNTKFQELNLNNSFLFAATMQDEENSRLVMELLLGRPIGDVHVNVEHSILFSSDYRSVRLDVYLSEESTGDIDCQLDYDVEMENELRDRNGKVIFTNRKALPKRSRLYQSEMDVRSLKPGDDFSALRPSCVIFICTYDPFEDGLYRYTFENICHENGQPLRDGTMKIFFNTKGTVEKDVPRSLVEFMRYVENSTDACIGGIADSRIHKLHENICILKHDAEWEGRFMRFGEMLDAAEKVGYRAGEEAGYRAGEEVGDRNGEKRTLDLISFMERDGKTDDIPRISKDPAFREEMLKRYYLLPDPKNE